MNANALDLIAPIDRSCFIGGSDSGAILGLSPWRTPLDVYLEKTGDAPPVDEARLRFFARGKRLEPVVLEMMQEEVGLTVSARNRRYVDPEHAFLAAEIDAETADGDNVEIKTVHPFLAKRWGDEDTDAIPDVYCAQALHGLMVTGRQRCLFGVLFGADDLRTYRVERDEEAIALLRARELEFWQRVQTRTPPPPKTLEDVATLFPRDAGQIAEVTDQRVIDAIFELRELKEQLKTLEARKDHLELTIKGAMGVTTVLTLGGQKACSWKAQTTRRIDIAALKATEPTIAERFTKSIESRVFRLS